MDGHDHDVPDRLKLSSRGWTSTEEATVCLCGRRHEVEHHCEHDEILLLWILLQHLDSNHVLIVVAYVGSPGDVGAGRIGLLVVRVNRVECHEVGRTPVPHVGGDDYRSVEVAGSKTVQRVHEGG